MQLYSISTLVNILFLAALFLGSPVHSIAQNENDIFQLRFQNHLDCNSNVLTSTIQIKAQSDTFLIGTSSILINYDENVLSFLDYTSINFDENETVDVFGTSVRVWDSHKFNSSFSGIFNLTLLLELAAVSRPIIGIDWIDIGQIRFNVTNLNATPNLVFDAGNTNFNRHIPNDGSQAPMKGDLSGFNELLATQCACNPPSLTNDTLNFDCPESSFEANLLSNDIVSNPTVSILTPPANGTATINTNGMLTYNATNISCGTDQLTYKICNDGDMNCCEEATVVIHFIDASIPTIQNAPTDITISCDAIIPTSELISAFDNCPDVQLTLNETTQAGNCAGNKVHIRTWTAIDLCGNQATHTQRITVIDEVAPTISCSEETTINCSSLTNNVIEVSFPTVADNCTNSADIDLSFTDEIISEVCENNIRRKLVRTWTVTDLCGNTATCIQAINIVDTFPPIINCPADLTVDCGTNLEPTPLESQATAVDDCGTNIITFQDSNTIPNDCTFDQVQIIRTWTATDDCGNASTCEQKITILGITCPTPSQETLTIVGCDGDTVNIFSKLQLNTSDSILVEQASSINLAQIILESLGTTCGVTQKELTITINNEEGCPTRNITVQFQILLPVQGEIVYESDSTFCQPSLVINCPNQYGVHWEDNFGLTGQGNTYNGVAETTGFVTFYVQPNEETLGEYSCAIDSFFADFNCPIECPKTIERKDSFTVCGETIINLFEHIDLIADVTYQVDNVEVVNGNYEIGNTFGCEIGEKKFQLKAYDDNQCLTEIIEVTITILPALYAEILTTTDANCDVSLTLECPENYVITWEDTNGNTGEGTSYSAASNTSGTVTFRVVYKEDVSLAAFDSDICIIAEFQSDFNCCNPFGTSCDDGDQTTYDDQEDGNCGCFGTNCGIEYKGIIKDYTGLDGCSLIIETSDGAILEPLAIPEDVILVAGQEIIFSYIDLIDAVSLCQTGKLVQIICLENICPAAGTPCIDGDLATINDVQDGNCNCIGETLPEPINEIDLRMRPNLNCESNSYCVTLQAKAQNETVSLGNSSIMLKYNENALEFASYGSIQFDENETCIGGTSSPWDNHQFDAFSVSGLFSLTLNLNSTGESCPEITTNEWEDIGMLCFDIMDNNANPAITFDSLNTHFNQSVPNDGTAMLKISQLFNQNEEGLLFCEPIDVGTSSNEVFLKAILQGSFNANTCLMSDELRQKEYLPLSEPYTGIPSFIHYGEGGGETVDNSVFKIEGDDAIVDWVFLELRSDLNASSVITTRAALIQSDGDIVDVDGVSTVKFNVPEDAYYICVKHRNHLGVMTASPINLQANEPASVDFSDRETPTYGTNAQLQIGNKMVLWGGNANPDKYIILAGGGLGLPDRDMIFFDIFLSLWYANPGTTISYNSVLHGYYTSDTNLDGKVKYQGPKNDIDAIIFFNVLFHPANTGYRLNFAITEQIP